ncbi:peptidoglycan-binding protein [Nocardiopsis gilva YIM 90087]|uniref:Peptidoglycan-binding protein n=1 Tax=Nocardiopsis gilva YIM 90087 TaxID=1235441 RepID=A0A223SCN3_9ACTN|nr:peptidoglycan-binding protein [Nocardiopsis gilva]ASU85908.1 peptidoglycan-binding protein [Nocardiopsis gilva YIM 90087]
MSVETPATVTDQLADEESPRGRGRRLKITIVTLVLLLVAALAAMGAVLGWGGPDKDSDSGASAPGATAQVQRTTLEERKSVDGKLGYGGGGSVVSGAEGVVTWLPKGGKVIDPGGKLYEVDGKPVSLLRGDKPAFRTLAVGDKGEDVRQFEQALSELGYGGFTVDNEYTELTAYAVKRWQKQVGLPQSGEVDPANVWFASGSVRVSGKDVKVGERTSPSAPVMSTTSGDRGVDVPLKVEDRELVSKGDQVDVELPGGGKATGTVTSVGSVAKEEQSDDGNPDGGGGDTVIDVVIKLDDVPKGQFFDQAPVKVALVSDSVEDVLAVPVGALTALPGGGYGVSVVDKNGGVKDVEVETGMFADGQVEISGDGIKEGTEVVVPE